MPGVRGHRRVGPFLFDEVTSRRLRLPQASSVAQAATLRRAPTLARVADTAVFLASDRAGDMTGNRQRHLRPRAWLIATIEPHAVPLG